MFSASTQWVHNKAYFENVPWVSWKCPCLFLFVLSSIIWKLGFNNKKFKHGGDCYYTEVGANISVFNTSTQCFHCRASFSVYCLLISFETNTLLSPLPFVLFYPQCYKIIVHNELMRVFHEPGLSSGSRAHLSWICSLSSLEMSTLIFILFICNYMKIRI